MIATQPIMASIEASTRYENLRPVIIQLDSDETITKATNDLQATIKSARIVNPVTKEDFIEIEKKTYSEVFIVGHGDSSGLQFISGHLTWDEVSEAIDLSLSFKHYILACYSFVLDNHPKVIRTFKGLVDVDIALVVTKATREVISLTAKESPDTNQIIVGYQKEVLNIWKNKLENNDFEFLTTISYWRGWYWDRYPGDNYNSISYDHPNRAIHSISMYSTCVRPNTQHNVHVVQLDKNVVSLIDAVYTILVLFFSVVATTYIGIALAEVLTVAALGLASIIIGVAVGILGILIHELLNLFLKDEEGAIWGVMRDIKLNKFWIWPISIEYYLKLGAVWWLGITHFLANPTIPLIVPTLTGNNRQIRTW